MKVALPLLAVLLCLALESRAGQPRSASRTAGSMERKLQHIEKNGALSHPDSRPTELTEDEINSQIASGGLDLPAGIQSLHFQGQPGIVTATTRVDFDQLQGGQTSMNPLLEVFTGVHETVVIAHTHGAGGIGYVHVDSVSIDGVDIPRFVLQLFVEKFLKPKYPDVGLDSKFPLPDRIDAATVGLHSLTVVQK